MDEPSTQVAEKFSQLGFDDNRENTLWKFKVKII